MPKDNWFCFNNFMDQYQYRILTAPNLVAATKFLLNDFDWNFFTGNFIAYSSRGNYLINILRYYKISFDYTKIKWQGRICLKCHTHFKYSLMISLPNQIKISSCYLCEIL